HSYLWGAGLWVGGIIDGDTLLSMGVSDGNYYVGGMHFRPVDSGGSVYLIGGPGDKQFEADYEDYFPNPFYFEPNFRKLQSIHVREISRSWSYAPHDDFVLIELLITNIGERLIEDAYVGFYVDCDVKER